MKDKFIGEDPIQEHSNEVQDQIQKDIEDLADIVGLKVVEGGKK